MKFFRSSLMTLVAGLALVQGARADISLYVSAPGVQTAVDIQGTISTETFNSMPVGAPPLSFLGGNGGTYTSTVDDSVHITENNQYGGYEQGNYLSIDGVGSTETLTFSSGINYFGMLWSAGDATNKLSFYDTSGVLIASYNTGDLLTFLPHNDTSTIKALNGAVYYTGNYYGQATATGPVPTTAPQNQGDNAPELNTAEPYAYLHFVSETNNIGKIVFEKVSSNGNFESDNHSVAANAVVPGDSSVVLVHDAIPEPTSLVLVATGLGYLALRRRVRG